MARILYLVHRMPYPPDKGDKVRSYHLLRHLARRHEVHLGTFVDDEADLAHIDTVRQWCTDVMAVPLNPRVAKVKSLLGLMTRQALTLRYFHSAALHRWVRKKARQQAFDASVVFSSSMAPYALQQQGTGRILMDFVDMDSAKWVEYGRRHGGLLGWVYAREGRELLAHERRVACSTERSYFVTERECELFFASAPECRGRVRALGNGVDADQFKPDAGRENPFEADEKAVVFTGAMDYWPNIDAVEWAVREILPALQAKMPGARVRLWIVGRNPSPAVQALAGPDVRVTGTVPDVRPYLQHAAAVVAPLRLARGVQNKVLEAMAMGCAVVAARSCVEALTAQAPSEILGASEPHEYVQALVGLMEDAELRRCMGQAARQRVLADYSWDAHLSVLDADLSTDFGAAHGASVWPLAQGVHP